MKKINKDPILNMDLIRARRKKTIPAMATPTLPRMVRVDVASKPGEEHQLAVSRAYEILGEVRESVSWPDLRTTSVRLNENGAAVEIEFSPDWTDAHLAEFMRDFADLWEN